MFECSAKYDRYQTDCFATKSDFEKSQTRTAAIVLSCPDMILHGGNISRLPFKIFSTLRV